MAAKHKLVVTFEVELGEHHPDLSQVLEEVIAFVFPRFEECADEWDAVASDNDVSVQIVDVPTGITVKRPDDEVDSISGKTRAQLHAEANSRTRAFDKENP